MCPDRWPFNDRNSVSIDERHQGNQFTRAEIGGGTHARSVLPLHAHIAHAYLTRRESFISARIRVYVCTYTTVHVTRVRRRPLTPVEHVYAGIYTALSRGRGNEAGTATVLARAPRRAWTRAKAAGTHNRLTVPPIRVEIHTDVCIARHVLFL